MRYIYFSLGTILAVLFIVQLVRGRRYEVMVENLDEKAYPLKDLYGVGYAWSCLNIFQLKGKMLGELKKQASTLYEVQYSEYYANVTWAQMITLVHLFIAVTLLMTGIMKGMEVLVLLAGIFLSVVAGIYCLEYMKNEISKRREECESQLPEVVSTMAVLVNSGMILREAWNKVADNGDGAFYDLMKQASENMRNGLSDIDAIFLFGKASNSVEIKKFTSALLQSMGKGGTELASFLASQSSELWKAKKQYMLQQGEKAATKLLLPMVLIFVGVILIVMTAAFAGSLF